MLTNFTSNMMVVKLMIILTWIFATVSAGTRIIRLLFVAWPCLGVSSQKTVSISALMGCCCAGLGMRLARLARALYLIFSPGCSLAGLPGQSCLLPARGRGGNLCQQDGYLDRQPAWAALAGQANPGVTGDTQPRA